jgi:hypothetical protein
MLRQAILILLVFTGCQWSENRYAKREIPAAELFGTWQLTDFGLKSLRDVGVKDHLTKEQWKLILRPDGSCVAQLGTDVPPDERGDSEYRVFDAGCAWRLDRFKHQEVRLFVPSQDFQAFFFLAEEGGKVISWQHATDPDAWRYVEFEKVAGT